MAQNKKKEEIQWSSETIINGSRVFVEDGEVKEILSEEIQQTGYMTLEESRRLTLATIKKVYEMDEDETHQ